MHRLLPWTRSFNPAHESFKSATALVLELECPSANTTLNLSPTEIPEHCAQLETAHKHNHQPTYESTKRKANTAKASSQHPVTNTMGPGNNKMKIVSLVETASGHISFSQTTQSQTDCPTEDEVWTLSSRLHASETQCHRPVGLCPPTETSIRLSSLPARFLSRNGTQLATQPCTSQPFPVRVRPQPSRHS